MAYKYNPLSGVFDIVVPSAGGYASIQELSSDPASPSAQQAWVLRTGSASIPDGTPIGLLLALTYTGNSGSSFTYQFSYRTTEGTTIRTSLS